MIEKLHEIENMAYHLQYSVRSNSFTKNWLPIIGLRGHAPPSIEVTDDEKLDACIDMIYTYLCAITESLDTDK